MDISYHRRGYSKFDGSDHLLCSNGFYHAIYVFANWSQIVFMVFKYVLSTTHTFK